MKQALSQRASVMRQEVPAISSRVLQPPTTSLAAQSRLGGNARPWPQVPAAAPGPPSPGLCTRSDLPLSPTTPAPASHMAFVWDPRGASVPALSTRVKSRLRLSKSYRYCSSLFVAGMNFVISLRHPRPPAKKSRIDLFNLCFLHCLQLAG